MTTNNNTPGQLFDLRQRADGKWTVWTRKSPAELGMVNREAVEAQRGAAFTDEAWAAFLGQPHFIEPTVWVLAHVSDIKPTVDAVLAMLGVKRKPRPEGAKAGGKGQQIRNKRPMVAGVGRVNATEAVATA